MKKIILTRPQAQSETLARQLTGQGHDVLCAPMLRFETQATTLPPATDFDALVFTSPQAVLVFSQISTPRQLPVFTVGQATAAAAAQIGLKNIKTAQNSAQSLLDLIKNEAKPQNLLHICGQNLSNDLKSLENHGFSVTSCPVYAANPVETLPAATISAIQAENVDAVLFFSARTAENFVKLVQMQSLTHFFGGVRALCLSPAIARTPALQTLGWQQIIAAPRPEPAALLEQL